MTHLPRGAAAALLSMSVLASLLQADNRILLRDPGAQNPTWEATPTDEYSTAEVVIEGIEDAAAILLVRANVPEYTGPAERRAEYVGNVYPFVSYVSPGDSTIESAIGSLCDDLTHPSSGYGVHTAIVSGAASLIHNGGNFGTPILSVSSLLDDAVVTPVPTGFGQALWDTAGVSSTLLDWSECATSTSTVLDLNELAKHLIKNQMNGYLNTSYDVDDPRVTDVYNASLQAGLQLHFQALIATEGNGTPPDPASGLTGLPDITMSDFARVTIRAPEPGGGFLSYLAFDLGPDLNPPALWVPGTPGHPVEIRVTEYDPTRNHAVVFTVLDPDTNTAVPAIASATIESLSIGGGVVTATVPANALWAPVSVIDLDDLPYPDPIPCWYGLFPVQASTSDFVNFMPMSPP